MATGSSQLPRGEWTDRRRCTPAFTESSNFLSPGQAPPLEPQHADAVGEAQPGSALLRGGVIDYDQAILNSNLPLK